MKLFRLFVLVFMLVAVFTLEKTPVDAAQMTSCAERNECILQAGFVRDDCVISCNYIVSCELGCEYRYGIAEAACIENHPCP